MKTIKGFKTIKHDLKIRDLDHCPFCLGSSLKAHSRRTTALKGVNCVMEYHHVLRRCLDCRRISTDERVMEAHYHSNIYMSDFVREAVGISQRSSTNREATEEIRKQLGHDVPISTLHGWAMVLFD